VYIKTKVTTKIMFVTSSKLSDAFGSDTGAFATRFHGNSRSMATDDDDSIIS